MVKALIQNNGLKMNSSCIATVALILNTFCLSGRFFLFFLQRFDWDPNGDLYGALYQPFDTLAAGFSTFYQLESCCTWFDLWQKSVSMSKRSSKVITAFRVILRTYAVANFVAFNLIYAQVLSAPKFWGTVNNINQWTLITCYAIASPLLSRILCKDMSDVTNPNWKAASAIRLTGGNAIMCLLMFNLSFQFYVKLGLWNTMAQHMNETSVMGITQAAMVMPWGWYQYLQFAHRRYLTNFSGSRISQYFGFTTIGLKGSGRESSITSQKSTTASAVSSASTAEGTMA